MHRPVHQTLNSCHPHADIWRNVVFQTLSHKLYKNAFVVFVFADISEAVFIVFCFFHKYNFFFNQNVRRKWFSFYILVLVR